ncbi:MAG: long-chain fatty acid--CoA ligase [SAR324 cluster bacterium]|nr:long-chain fatty acid--CoA ligase [SAR324 cluster bacterium]
MSIEVLLERLDQYSTNEAIVHNGQVFSYHELQTFIAQWSDSLAKNQILSGTVVAVIGDYSLDAIALMIALIDNKNIILPLTSLAKSHFIEYFEIAHTQFVIDLTQTPHHITQQPSNPLQNELMQQLIEMQHPGLILFTSGSTGQPKAVVHDFEKLLKKFINAKKQYRSLVFLMFDHIAGIDTYFYALYSGGTMVFPASRASKQVCQLIEKYKVEVLPASPTFLNLLLLSGEYLKYDLTSLKIITFGSERMPEPLLKRLNDVFDGVRLVQKYGITELGAPPSKAMEDDALWLKIDSPQYQSRIVDGTLHIKTDTAMLGYLNAPSPFTQDGWFDTGDQVEVDGDYVRILGRASELINVGGEKVHPVEVEEVIQMMEGVEDVIASGLFNQITGALVQIHVKLSTNETRSQFRQRMRNFCEDKLPRYKVPQKVTVVQESLHGERFKKIRR